MSKQNGGIIGPDNVTTGGAFGTASGVFKLGEVTDLIKDSKWPTAGPGGHQVANSARFNDGSSDYLTRTQTAGNRRTWTWSAWVKFSNIATGEHDQKLFLAHSNTHPSTQIITNSMRLGIYTYDGSSTNFNVTCNRFLRDSSAWFHLVIAVDTTQGTDSNRVKIYINGVQETSFLTASYPSQNFETEVNDNTEIAQVSGGGTPSNPFDGYMAEVVLIDGQALAPTSFGEFDSDSGIWKPIDVSGLTFGTNGFYLDFKDSSALGNDAAGSNNFTANNLTSIDQSVDTCTNNFSTMNVLDNFYFGGTFSEGNLKVVSNSGVESYLTNTIAVSTGKWYWEIKVTSSGSNRDFIGIADKVSTNTNFTPYSGNSKVLSYYGYTGQSMAGSTGTSYGATFTTGDIIGVAMDLDNNKLYFSKNGTFQNSGDPTSGSTGTGALAIDASPADGVYYAQFANIHNTVSTFEANFGSPSFAISSGNADGNGFGNFEYAPPSGYLALCTNNLNA